MGKVSFASLWLALLSVVGCGPSVTVVRQAVPNPFHRAATFALAPLDLASMTIDGLPTRVWIAQSGCEGSALRRDLDGAQSAYAEAAGIAAGGAIRPSARAFMVHTRVGAWSRGFYNYITNPATTVALGVRITTRQGAVLDELWLSCRASHSLVRPTPVQGLHVAMSDCGEQLGLYLRQRRLSLLGRSRALALAGPGGARR